MIKRLKPLIFSLLLLFSPVVLSGDSDGLANVYVLERDGSSEDITFLISLESLFSGTDNGFYQVIGTRSDDDFVVPEEVNIIVKLLSGNNTIQLPFEFNEYAVDINGTQITLSQGGYQVKTYASVKDNYLKTPSGDLFIYSIQDGTVQLSNADSITSPSEETDEVPELLTGVFRDSALGGVSYQSCANQDSCVSGQTTADGVYEYFKGSKVSFSVGNIQLGVCQGSALTVPRDLDSVTNDEAEVNMASFLMSLDANNNPDDGITISNFATNKGATLPYTPLDFSNREALASVSQDLGGDLVSPEAAAQHLSKTQMLKWMAETGDRFAKAYLGLLSYNSNSPSYNYQAMQLSAASRLKLEVWNSIERGLRSDDEIYAEHVTNIDKANELTDSILNIVETGITLAASAKDLVNMSNDASAFEGYLTGMELVRSGVGFSDASLEFFFNGDSKGVTVNLSEDSAIAPVMKGAKATLALASMDPASATKEGLDLEGNDYADAANIGFDLLSTYTETLKEQFLNGGKIKLENKVSNKFSKMALIGVGIDGLKTINNTYHALKLSRLTASQQARLLAKEYLSAYYASGIDEQWMIENKDVDFDELLSLKSLADDLNPEDNTSFSEKTLLSVLAIPTFISTRGDEYNILQAQSNRAVFEAQLLVNSYKRMVEQKYRELITLFGPVPSEEGELEITNAKSDEKIESVCLGATDTLTSSLTYPTPYLQDLNDKDFIKWKVSSGISFSGLSVGNDQQLTMIEPGIHTIESQLWKEGIGIINTDLKSYFIHECIDQEAMSLVDIVQTENSITFTVRPEFQNRFTGWYDLELNLVESGISYSVDKPLTNDSGYKIKPFFSDLDELDFSTLGSHPAAIMSPNGGETLSSSSERIFWDNSQISGDTVSMYVLHDDPVGLNNCDNNASSILSCKNWYKFASQVTNDGSYQFNSSDMDNGGNPYVLLIISDQEQTLFDVSDTTFTITSPPASEIINETRKLNDTGITWGGNYPSGNNATCIGETIGEQDCSHGRDALAAAGQLTKVGGGDAGFDFTKLDANGNDLPASATSWSCVRDNHTGLVWEVKTNDGGIHDRNNTYRWGGKTAQLIGESGTRYNDWDVLVDGSNNESLCGYTDWRLPNLNELLSIAHLGKTRPAIDTDYFANTQSASSYWSSLPRAASRSLAMGVFFRDGSDCDYSRYYRNHVRLVRSGQ